MRLGKRVPWVGCVWFLAVTAGSWPGGPGRGLAVAPAAAETKDHGASQKAARKKAAIHRCVDYSQDMDDDGMSLHLRNRCGMDLQCSMSWEVVCQSDGEQGQKGASVFGLDDDTSNGAYASAASCGDDGWRVRSVRWSCTDDDEG